MMSYTLWIIMHIAAVLGDMVLGAAVIPYTL